MTSGIVQDLREEFSFLYQTGQFVIDKSGVKTIEVIGSSFVADEELIFGDVNRDYVARELEWYLSCSLYVDDIPGKTPEIWNQVASRDGKINSNYGYLIFGHTNGFQYENVLRELYNNPNSRRAVMIYTRPSMHVDYKYDGMSDFVCTNAVNYFIRDGELHAVVQMRSNDSVFGFRNDYAWQKYVLDRLCSDLAVKPGLIYWNAASLHIYERHFYLVHHYARTGETSITKTEYDAIYGEAKS